MNKKCMKLFFENVFNGVLKCSLKGEWKPKMLIKNHFKMFHVKEYFFELTIFFEGVV